MSPCLIHWLCFGGQAKRLRLNYWRSVIIWHESNSPMIYYPLWIIDLTSPWFCQIEGINRSLLPGSLPGADSLASPEWCRPCFDRPWAPGLPFFSWNLVKVKTHGHHLTDFPLTVAGKIISNQKVKQLTDESWILVLSLHVQSAQVFYSVWKYWDHKSANPNCHKFCVS